MGLSGGGSCQPPRVAAALPKAKFEMVQEEQKLVPVGALAGGLLRDSKSFVRVASPERVVRTLLNSSATEERVAFSENHALVSHDRPSPLLP